MEKIEKDQKRVKAFPDRCELKRQKQDRKSVTNGRRPTCRVNRRWYAHALPKRKKGKEHTRTHTLPRIDRRIDPQAVLHKIDT